MSCKLVAKSRILTRFRFNFFNYWICHIWYDTLSGSSQMIFLPRSSNCLSSSSSKINTKKQIKNLSFLWLLIVTTTKKQLIIYNSLITKDRNSLNPKNSLIRLWNHERHSFLKRANCIRYYLDWISVLFLPFLEKWFQAYKNL